MEPTSTLIVLKELAGNPPVALSGVQLFLEPHLDLLITLWRTVWVVTVMTLAFVFFNEWRAQKK